MAKTSRELVERMPVERQTRIEYRAEELIRLPRTIDVDRTKEAPEPPPRISDG